MAGYISKAHGFIYNGEFKAGEVLNNGDFVALDSTTSTWKKAATATLTNPLYFVENVFDDVLEDGVDQAKLNIPAGAFVKAHRCLAGEEYVKSVDSTLYATLNVGDTVIPANGGTIAKGTTGAAPIGVIREKLTLWGLPAVRVEVMDTYAAAASGD